LAFPGGIITYNTPERLDFVRGDDTGLKIPAHGDALRSVGGSFLTKAFHRFGSLPPDNRVTRINRFEPCLIGSTGQKWFLSIVYAHPQPSLPTELFVKFSRDFTDGIRDRRRNELASEIRLAALSRIAGFPINVPAACFGDFHRESGTGVLITERISFGTGDIEPLHRKCLDHELEHPLAYYRAIVSVLARLAAAHKSGRLGTHVDALFPFDPVAAALDDPIPYDEPQLGELVARYAAFAETCPRLLPKNIASAQFIARLERDAVLFKRHEATIKQFLHADGDFVALSHFNAHIDNAWFWRDPSGVLQCGLLDWQRARQMNVAYALWGALSGAGLEIWANHLDELLELFSGELHAGGGPRLDVAGLKLHMGLYAATMGLAGMMEVPRIVLFRLPEAAEATGPLDPMFEENESARGFLHVFTVLLNFWETHDFGAGLERVLREGA
jgi:hypothetical protein